MNITNTKKIQIFKDYIGSSTGEYGIIHKIYAALDHIDTQDYLDIEFCYYYENLIIDTRCKFEIFSNNQILLEKLLHITELDSYHIDFYLKNDVRSVQFVLSNNGIIEKTASNFIQRSNGVMEDFSLVRRLSTLDMEPQKRTYRHLFPDCYEKNIGIGMLNNTFKIVDVFYNTKLFFSKKENTIYFLLKKGEYSGVHISDFFKVDIPKFVSDTNLSCWCICVIKGEHEEKNYKNFSIYFGTYGL